MNQYTIELRIEGEALSPEQVTAQLGIEPSLVRHRGERRGRTSTHAKSLWAFGGPRPGQVWPTLEAGLRILLDELTPIRSRLLPYLQTCEVYWWCGSFQSGFSGDIRLSTELLRALGAFGARLLLATCFSEETDTEDGS